MALDDPKILLSLLTWRVYSFAMLARPMMGWTGRRAAWLAALGFVDRPAELCCPFNYFLSTSHTFD